MNPNFGIYWVPSIKSLSLVNNLIVVELIVDTSITFLFLAILQDFYEINLIH